MPVVPTSAVFPPLQARNLNGRKLVLPAEFAGARNVVVVAFRRWHQPLVDAWFPALEPLLAAYPDLRAYELPMIASQESIGIPLFDTTVIHAMAAVDYALS